MPRYFIYHDNTPSLTKLKDGVVDEVTLPSQNFRTIFHHRNRMLKMRRQTLIGGTDRPLIPVKFNPPIPQRSHGLNRDHHSFAQFRTSAFFSKIRNQRLLMQLMSHAMSRQIAYYP